MKGNTLAKRKPNNPKLLEIEKKKKQKAIEKTSKWVHLNNKEDLINYLKSKKNLYTN
jgi:heterodisulfide reductase subunit C